MKYKLLLDNIGRVWHGDDLQTAKAWFQDYRNRSITFRGSAVGGGVWLIVTEKENGKTVYRVLEAWEPPESV